MPKTVRAKVPASLLPLTGRKKLVGISVGACRRIPVDDTVWMDDELGERLTLLESKIAHLEHLAERLNEVVTEQARELHQLKRKVEGQAQSLETIELERIRATNPRPPHYE